MTGVRAGDQDRDKAVEAIEHAFAIGQLNDAERELRTQKALQATTLDELNVLTSDLKPGVIRPAGNPLRILIPLGIVALLLLVGGFVALA